tara:strand:+ start:3852 stop:4046 length:195 start_codon:yes stop_codon:yes gene_type:complete
MSCVIKYDHDDGERLPKHKQELWCGKSRAGFDWCFQDAQHAALADKPICNSCRANIKKALDGKE